MNSSKPSFLTGEFWLTALSNVPMIACTLKGHDSVPCLVLSGLANLAFIWKRGGLKEKALELGLEASRKLASEKVEK